MPPAPSRPLHLRLQDVPVPQRPLQGRLQDGTLLIPDPLTGSGAYGVTTKSPNIEKLCPGKVHTNW